MKKLSDYDPHMADKAVGLFQNSNLSEYCDQNVVVFDQDPDHLDHEQIINTIQQYMDQVELDLIVFSQAGEGLETNYAKLINSVVEHFAQRGFPTSKFAYVTCIDWCSGNQSRYAQYKKQHNFTYLPDILCANTSTSMLLALNQSILNSDTLSMDCPDKTHNFLCLNHTIRIPRYLFLAEVYNNNLQDQFLASLHTTYIDHTEHSDVVRWSKEINKQYFTETGFDKIPLDLIRRHIPLKLGYEPSKLFSLTAGDQDLFNSTRVNIVTESLFCDSHQHLLEESHRGIPPFQITSEKILKPIMMGSPFIAVSTPGLLKSLRELGYETFDGIIDESYDTIEHDYDRMQAVLAEVKRLSRFTDRDWQHFNDQIRSKVQFNKQHMRNRANQNQFRWLSEV